MLKTSLFNLAWLILLTSCSSSPIRSDQENYDEIVNNKRGDIIRKYFTENSYVYKGNTVINLPKACFPEPVTLNQLQELIQAAENDMRNCYPAKDLNSNCFKNLGCKFLSYQEIKDLRKQEDSLKQADSQNKNETKKEEEKISSEKKAQMLNEEMKLRKNFIKNGCILLGEYNTIQQLDKETFLLKVPCLGRSATSGLCTSFDQLIGGTQNFGTADAIFKTTQKTFIGGVLYLKKIDRVKKMPFQDGAIKTVFFFKEDQGCHELFSKIKELQFGSMK